VLVLVGVSVIPGVRLDQRDVVAVAVGEDLRPGVVSGAPRAPLDVVGMADVPTVERE
jgi:hypothetical protein